MHHSGEGCNNEEAVRGNEIIWEISVTSQFCCETNTALKNLVKTWTNGKKFVLSQEFSVCICMRGLMLTKPVVVIISENM